MSAKTMPRQWACYLALCLIAFPLAFHLLLPGELGDGVRFALSVLLGVPIAVISVRLLFTRRWR